jgi:hypothetical protein
MWELGQWQASRGNGVAAPVAAPAVAPAAVAPAAVAPPAVAPPTFAQPAPVMAHAPAAPPVAAPPRPAAPVEVATTGTERGAVVHKLKRRGGRATAPAPAARAEAAPAVRAEAATAPAPAKPRKQPRVKAEKQPKAAKLPKAAKAEPQRPVLDLQPGEAILGELKGRSHLRRTTLYVTNFRVAQARFGNRVAWIPHEHIDDVRARGKSIDLHSSIETISIRASRDDVAGILELIERYMASARRPGARFDPTLVQEWCDRSGDMWDSHTGRIRLWVRRHPVVTLSTLGAILGTAKLIGP